MSFRRGDVSRNCPFFTCRFGLDLNRSNCWAASIRVKLTQCLFNENDAIEIQARGRSLNVRLRW